jgi:hypothetical protein
MAIAAISAHAQEDVYKAEMDILDAQGEAIIKEYRALMKADPKGEKPTTAIKVAQFSATLDSISNEQLKLVKRIIRDKYQYKDQGMYFDTQSIPNQEIGRYYLSGLTGLFFTLYVSEPINLEYIADEWEP